MVAVHLEAGSAHTTGTKVEKNKAVPCRLRFLYFNSSLLRERLQLQDDQRTSQLSLSESSFYLAAVTMAETTRAVLLSDSIVAIAIILLDI